MRVHTLRMSRALAAVIVGVALLAGCTPQQPDFDAKTAEGLQATVLQIGDRASIGDFNGALTELNDLQTELRQDTAAGTVTGDRSTRIQAAIDLVRKDVEAKIPTPAPTPVPTKTSAGKHDSGGPGDNNGNGTNGKNDNSDNKGKR
ncbi:MAG TPA: hypothetical protein VIJ18_04855 [Microbacteriaceae bacterium]